jgi:hypothetical protein
MARFVYDYALGQKRRCEGLLLEMGRWYDGISCGCHDRIEVYVSSRLCRLLPPYLPPSVEEQLEVNTPRLILLMLMCRFFKGDVAVV